MQWIVVGVDQGLAGACEEFWAENWLFVEKPDQNVCPSTGFNKSECSLNFGGGGGGLERKLTCGYLEKVVYFFRNDNEQVSKLQLQICMLWNRCW